MLMWTVPSGTCTPKITRASVARATKGMSPPVDAMTVVLKITGLSHPENVPERLLNRVRKVMR